MLTWVDYSNCSTISGGVYENGSEHIFWRKDTRYSIYVLQGRRPPRHHLRLERPWLTRVALSRSKMASSWSSGVVEQVLYHQQVIDQVRLFLFERFILFLVLTFGIVLEPGRACAGRFVFFDQLVPFRCSRKSLPPSQSLYFSSLSFASALSRVPDVTRSLPFVRC
jgi:hypothetical protein